MAHTETQHDLTIFKVHLCGGKPLKNPQSQGCSGSLMVDDFVDPRLVYPASGWRVLKYCSIWRETGHNLHMNGVS